MTPLEAALAYASVMGWAVFPVTDRSRLPLAGSHGHLDASAHAPTIYDMFSSRIGGIGVAVRCGKDSNLLVVDVDEKGGRSGSAYLEREGLLLPPTARARTRSGGKHYFYRCPWGARSRNDLHGNDCGVDVKAEGGYVAAWPTTGYRWELEGGKLRPEMLAEAPSWAIVRRESVRPSSAHDLVVGSDRIADVFGLVEGAARRVFEAPGGRRNDELNRVAFSAGLLVAGGWISEGDLVRELTAAAKAAGLGDKEIGWTIASGLRGAARRRVEA